MKTGGIAIAIPVKIAATAAEADSGDRMRSSAPFASARAPVEESTP